MENGVWRERKKNGRSHSPWALGEDKVHHQTFVIGKMVPKTFHCLSLSSLCLGILWITSDNISG
jgi:hypothetical protein